MVLVSNEWPNKSEDEQKSTTTTTSSASSTTTTQTTTNVTAAAADETAAATPTSATSTTTTTDSSAASVAVTSATAAATETNTATLSSLVENTTDAAEVIAGDAAAATSNSTSADADDTATKAENVSTGTLKSTAATVANAACNEQEKERSQKPQKAELEDGEEDTLSNSSTLSDLDHSTATIKEYDNNNTSLGSSNNNSTAAQSAAFLSEIAKQEHLEREKAKNADAAAEDDDDADEDAENDDENEERREKVDENREAYNNGGVSANNWKKEMNKAFKSMNTIDNYTNKRTSTGGSGGGTPSGNASSIPNSAKSTSAPSTANNTITNAYLSTFGIGLSSNNTQNQQQMPLKSGYTAITTNILDAQQHANNNNNNNVNTMNNNNTLNSSLAQMGVSISSASNEDSNKNEAKIVLLCESNSHPFKTRTIPLTPNIECKVGRLIARSKSLETNAIFDCKVLSRNHAVLWYTDDGKFWVKDTKSSNGTFINDRKLGNDAAELHFGDIVKFGVDVWENTRKEAHGCIIALVRLYLPDGREAIDPDTQRTQFSGEGRISYDEMHRLNMFMQEAAAREKGLKTKLCSIQTVLDTTRKNSALCWQSMVNEDQLLHRINSLEKKLQIMDKNVPESVLRNEVLKLLDDKNSYQITAKEALRKVYQERCDALQMLAKVESDYATAENECLLLREEITVTKQTMQDINERLMQLETEYHDYKDEIQRQQLEAKAKEEEHVHSLHEQLEQREMECDNLQRQIVQLQSASSTMNHQNSTEAPSGKVMNRKKKKSAASSVKDDDTVGTTDTDDEEKEVIEKLDAAIGSFMGGIDDLDDDSDDDDDDDDDDEEDHDDDEDEYGDEKQLKSDDSNEKGGIKTDELRVLDELEKVLQESETFNGKSDHKRKKQNKDLKQKVVKKSTIMKWLKNSDLNKKEGSMDIFKAMFNNEDEDSSGEQNDEDNKDEIAGAGANNKLDKVDEEEDKEQQKEKDKAFEMKLSSFRSKLQNVQNNLEQLEADIASNEGKIKDEIVVKTEIIANDMEEDSDDTDEENCDEDEDQAADDEFIINRNGASKANSASMAKKVSKSSLAKNRNYELLRQSVEILRQAYNEISEVKPLNTAPTATPTTDQNSPLAKKQTARFQSQDTLKPLEECDSGEEGAEEVSAVEKPSMDGPDMHSENEEDGAESSRSASTNDSSPSSPRKSKLQVKYGSNLTVEQHDTLKNYESQIKLLELQINDMRKQMQQNENDAQHTLEIMQIECDTYKMKLNDMTLMIDTLRDEKYELESRMKESNNMLSSKKEGDEDATTNSDGHMMERRRGGGAIINSDASSSAEDTMNFGFDSCKSDASFEKELGEERAAQLALEREEELIAFKERLEQQQQINHNLLMQMDELKAKGLCTTQNNFMQKLIPFGVIVIAALVYFATQNIL